MLKQIKINGKSIPVPVPLKNLEMTLKWVKTHFVQPGSLVTSVKHNGKEMYQ